MTTALVNVHLYGGLRRDFGDRFAFAIATPVEAFRALECAFPGRFLVRLRDGAYRIVRGDKKNGTVLTADTLTLGQGSADLHIIPVVAGAKRGGGAKIILGAVLIAAAIAFAPAGAGFAGAAMGETAFTVMGSAVTYGNIAMTGVSMLLSGAAQMLSPQPKSQSFEAADRKASFLFSGPVTSVEQGGAVPVVYGRVRAGGTLISAAITTDDIPA